MTMKVKIQKEITIIIQVITFIIPFVLMNNWCIFRESFPCPSVYLRIFMLAPRTTHTHRHKHPLTSPSLALQIPFTVTTSEHSTDYWLMVGLIERPGSLLFLLVNGDPANLFPSTRTPPILTLQLTPPFHSCSGLIRWHWSPPPLDLFWEQNLLR